MGMVYDEQIKPLVEAKQEVGNVTTSGHHMALGQKFSKELLEDESDEVKEEVRKRYDRHIKGSKGKGDILDDEGGDDDESDPDVIAKGIDELPIICQCFAHLVKKKTQFIVSFMCHSSETSRICELIFSAKKHDPLLPATTDVGDGNRSEELEDDGSSEEDGSSTVVLALAGFADASLQLTGPNQPAFYSQVRVFMVPQASAPLGSIKSFDAQFLQPNLTAIGYFSTMQNTSFGSPASLGFSLADAMQGATAEYNMHGWNFNNADLNSTGWGTSSLSSLLTSPTSAKCSTMSPELNKDLPQFAYQLPTLPAANPPSLTETVQPPKVPNLQAKLDKDLPQFSYQLPTLPAILDSLDSSMSHRSMSDSADMDPLPQPLTGNQGHWYHPLLVISVITPRLTVLSCRYRILPCPAHVRLSPLTYLPLPWHWTPHLTSVSCIGVLHWYLASVILHWYLASVSLISISHRMYHQVSHIASDILGLGPSLADYYFFHHTVQPPEVPNSQAGTGHAKSKRKSKSKSKSKLPMTKSLTAHTNKPPSATEVITDTPTVTAEPTTVKLAPLVNSTPVVMLANTAEPKAKAKAKLKPKATPISAKSSAVTETTHTAADEDNTLGNSLTINNVTQKDTANQIGAAHVLKCIPIKSRWNDIADAIGSDGLTFVGIGSKENPSALEEVGGTSLKCTADSTAECVIPTKGRRNPWGLGVRVLEGMGMGLDLETPVPLDN
ncbi:hypothetical protein F4604DRAFT_1677558 [Suillus subluteus]|nr:hypothetical protein F4604DRAFT_1677558 [Suillus subluteus]